MTTTCAWDGSPTDRTDGFCCDTCRDAFHRHDRLLDEAQWGDGDEDGYRE